MSQIAVGSLINCGPILSWLELDNRGHHLLVADGDHCAINTPAVAAAYSVRKYTANASDEISLNVMSILSSLLELGIKSTKKNMMQTCRV